MAKNSAANLLTSVDSLFTTQEERDIATQPRVQEIPIDQIDDFPNHPFKVRMDDNMIEMAESVKQHGILVPAIVRPKENGHYEMVAGHRRKLACTLIAKLQLPCIVRELTDEEATVIMVDSNLQREQLLPSEKAFAYKHSVAICLIVVYTTVIIQDYPITKKGSGSHEPQLFLRPRSSFLSLFFLLENARCCEQRAFSCFKV